MSDQPHRSESIHGNLHVSPKDIKRPRPTSAERVFKIGSSAPPSTASPSAPTSWSNCGSVFIVPYGPNITLARAKLFSDRIKSLGGKVANSARDADVIVVDPELRSEGLLKEHVFGPKIPPSTAKLTLAWLEEAIIKNRLIDPYSEEALSRFEFGIPRPAQQEFEPLLSGELLQRPQPRTVIDFNTSTPRANNAFSSSSSASSSQDRSFGDGIDSSEDELSDNGDDRKTELNMNQVLIDELTKMAEMCSARGDKWRAKSYAQAAIVIKQLNFPVQSSEQLKGYKGIGKQMASHIDEILTTGKYQKREILENDPRTASLINLTKIFGVGKTVAATLVNMGFQNVDDIRRGLNLGDPRLNFLNRNQRIGVELYEDINLRIKREEIEAIRDGVRRACEIAYPPSITKTLNVDATGSYRRGKKDCGDCDILMSCPAYPERRVVLRPLLRVLMNKKYLKETGMLITHSLSGEDKDDFNIPDEEYYERFRGRREKLERDRLTVSNIDAEKQVDPESFMGICRLAASSSKAGGDELVGPYHRIDIKSYAFECFPFALLYFTGSAMFSRNMRHVAHSKGYMLTDRGLFPYVPTMESLAGTSRLNRIPCKSEQEIFDVLSLEYKEPKDRNYAEVIDVGRQAGAGAGSPASSQSAAAATAVSVDKEQQQHTVKTEPDLYIRLMDDPGFEDYYQKSPKQA